MITQYTVINAIPIFMLWYNIYLTDIVISNITVYYDSPTFWATKLEFRWLAYGMTSLCMSSASDKVLFLTILLFFAKTFSYFSSKTCCDPSIELPHWGLLWRVTTYLLIQYDQNYSLVSHPFPGLWNDPDLWHVGKLVWMYVPLNILRLGALNW